MANIIIPRKEFEKEIKLTKEVKEKISLFGTPLECINDSEIEIEIFPNRPDLLSTRGFLRAFKAFLGISPGLKTYQIKKPLPNYEVKILPSVKSVRPYTACAIVKNLSLSEERIKDIINLQEKLHSTIGRNRKKTAIGIYPLEKITLPITYQALNPDKIKFIPLEFNRELTGRKILQRHPTGRTYAHLLENCEVYPVFSDANNKILSMPPIINSHETGKITEQTKDAFIECSGFHFQTLQRVLNIIVTTLADMGGQIFSMKLSYPKENFTTPDLTPETMKISLDNVNKLLGISLTNSNLAELLPKMGFSFSNNKVKIPAWRTDILHEVDIIEDVAIAYGYENFSPTIPNVSSIGELSLKTKTKEKISEILIGLGLLEIKTYHLVKEEEAKLFSLSELEKIETLDSKTEYKILRSNLLIPSLRVLSENINHEYPQKIFEIGTVFSSDAGTETGIQEKSNLLIINSPANFTEIKQTFDCLMSSLNISYKLQPAENLQLIEGRTAGIFIDGKKIGYLGEVHPQILKKFGIKMPAAVLEISLEEIFDILES